MIPVQAYAVMKSQAPLEPHRFERREPRDHDVVVDIHYCGICHSDVHQARNEWGVSSFPMVPGHEIAGVVSRIGPKVTAYRVGDKVGVGCLVDSCRKCRSCQEGLEQYCETGVTWTYNSFEPGEKTPTLGGYSTQIVVDENYVLKIPESLPLDAAAPLLCAGVTLYSPLKHWGAGPGKKIAIVGLGGLGHMGLKLAHAMGATVTMLSHSPKKKADALRLGADHFEDTSDPKTFARLKSSFDLIINTVSEKLDWNQYLELLVRDGTLVILGVPEHRVPIGAFSLTGARRRLAGSLIGSLRETQELLDFCGERGITSDIEVIPVQQVNEAYDRMVRSDVRYRFVIDIASLKE